MMMMCLSVGKEWDEKGPSYTKSGPVEHLFFRIFAMQRNATFQNESVNLMHQF